MDTKHNTPATPATPARRPWLGLVVVVLVTALGSQWWAARQQAQLGQQVAQWARPGDLQMLSSTTCPICAAARAWFEANDVKFSECFIETDAACAARFEATRSPGTPVIMVRGVAHIGFDPQRLREALRS